jgi:hypothetical protein
MATIPSDFFTPASMLTLAGATLITTVITNSCQHAFNWNPKWLGLVVGIVIGIIGVLLTENPKFVNYFMGIINGFLIYASATGIMQMGGTPAPQTGTVEKALQSRRKFWNNWY